MSTTDLAPAAPPTTAVEVGTAEPGLDSGLAALLVNADSLAQLDVDKVEKLVQLQRELTADKARQAFSRSLSAVQEALPAIPKRGKIDAGRLQSTWARLDDLLEEARPLMAANGLSWSTSQIDGAPDGLIRIRLRLRHTDGHHEDHWMDAALDQSGSKNSVQAAKSTWTYCTRTLLMRVLGAQECEDDDGQSADDGGPMDAPKLRQIRDRLADLPDHPERGAAEPRLCKALGIERLEELTLDRAGEALALTESLRRQLVREAE